MIGDVNIYMNDPDDLELAEIEIMIAEQKRYHLFSIGLVPLLITLDTCSIFHYFLFMGNYMHILAILTANRL